MIWDNLANTRCPRCGSKLETHGMLADYYTCTESHCLYKISKEKFIEISGRIKARIEAAYDPDKNLSELNNL